MPRATIDTNTVLVCRFSALGDVAMTIPIVYSAAVENPKMRFVVLTKKAVTGIFLNAPSNVEVVGIDLKDTRYKGAAGICRLYNDIRRRYGFGRFADLHSVLRSRLFGAFCRLGGIRTARIDKGRGEKRALTRHTGKSVQPLRSGFDRYSQVFASLGIAVGNNFTRLIPPAKPEAYAPVAEAKKEGERWIGIAPFAAHEGKIYPLEMMREVVNHFASLDSTKVFLFGGGKGEENVLDDWADGNDNVVSLAGRRAGFAVELAVQSVLDVMLSMDSANMHLASLVGTRVVSVWGATHPYCGFGGWRQPAENAMGLALDCRPCSVYGNKPCRRGDYFCLSGIKPQMIIDKITTLIYG